MQTYDSNLGLSYFRASARVIMIYLLPRPDYYYFLDYTLPFINKGLYSQSYGLSSSHARMWELDRKEGWMPKNWYFRSAVLKKTLESPLDNKEIKPVDAKGNQPWILIGRTDAEAPIPGPTDVNSRLIGKDPDTGKHWWQKEKRAAEDELVGWHHWFNGHELGQTLGDGEA